jgi:hypothetical protein
LRGFSWLPDGAGLVYSSSHADFEDAVYVRLPDLAGDVKVLITGLSRMWGLTGSPSLWGQIRPDGVVTLTNYYGNDQYDPVEERVAPTNLLAILVDESKLTVTPEGISGVFSGFFALYDQSETGWSHISSGCPSTSHSVTLSR